MASKRESWSSHLGFIFAAIGSAVGLGTLWMFPYITGQNGGGLFVFLYFFFTFFIGIPVFIAELLLGRQSRRGAVGTFIHFAHNKPAWKLIGWMGVLSSFLIMTYYSVVAGWGLNYVLMSLNQFWMNLSTKEIANVFSILEQSGDISLFWHFIFTGLTGLVVYQGVRKGIEYWSRIMTSILIIILIGLLCYSITLDGFAEAFRFIFYPDTTKLKPSGALEALGLAFFTLSLSQGIMITYGSYMQSNNNIPKISGIVAIMNVVVSLFAALMIFPIIFTFTASCSTQAGPGLVFKTLPIIFSQLKSGALIISTTFFILFVFTGLTSAVALIEVITANFIDLYDWPRKKTVIFISLTAYVCGIPSALSASKSFFPEWTEMYGISFFETVSSFVATWLLPIGGFLFSLFVGWVVKTEDLYKEFMQGSHNKKWLFNIWIFIIRWIIPFSTIIILIYKSGIINFDKIGLSINK